MSLISRMRKQNAVYWACTGVDRYGQPQYAAPVDVACRWEDVQEQFVDAAGAEVMSRSKVFVDRDMTIDGYLWLGTVATLTNAGDPRKNSNARRIRAFSKLPNLKATENLLTAMLI